MSGNLVILPILLPLLTAILLLFVHGRLHLQRVLSLAAAVLGLGIAIGLTSTVWSDGILTTQASNWAAPYGITLVVDLLSGIMLILTWSLAILTQAFAWRSVAELRQRYFFYPLMNFLLVGISGSFITGDIFNLFVWFEVLLISSYVLLYLGGEPRQLREALKYVIINVVASVLYLMMITLIYGAVGTVNMAHLAQLAAANPGNSIWIILALAFLVVFGLKAAVFPLYIWLPTAYFVPASAVSALFAGLMTKVGVYVLIRLYTLLFVGRFEALQPVVLTVGALTMVLGVLGAVAQIDMKRILAYHSISQVGYMVMGLGLFTPIALAGTIYFMLHHSVVKSALFLVGGVTEQIAGTTDLRRVRGLLSSHPGLAALFFVAASSLAGIPPFSGFIGKFILASDGFGQGQYAVAGVSLAVGILTLFSMIKIFRYGFWGEPVGRRRSLAGKRLSLLVPLGVLVVVTAAMGLGAGPLYRVLLAASTQLLQPQAYIQAVMGMGG